MALLVPMSPDDATRRLEASTAGYTQELVNAGMTRDAAAREALASLRRLLPDGVATPGHRFAGITSDGTAVGYAWFGPHPTLHDAAYLFDLEIDPAHRGRGLGGAALREVARIAAGGGSTRLGLQVFEANTGAIRLYERLGFETTRAGEGRREMWLDLIGEPTVDDLQRVMTGAWPAPETAPLGDWLLRAGRGFTQRANSVATTGDPGMGIEAALDAVEAWYAARGLPPNLTIAGPSGFDHRRHPVGAPAHARGYRMSTSAVTLTGSAHATAAHGGSPADVRITVGPALEEDWLTAYGASREVDEAAARAILTGSAAQAFATARGDGRVLAIGRLAVNDGWGGIAAMWTEPGARRRGLARAVLGALGAECLRHGVTRIHLQVESGNAAAFALYRSAGFTPHHGYVNLRR